MPSFTLAVTSLVPLSTGRHFLAVKRENLEILNVGRSAALLISIAQQSDSNLDTLREKYIDVRRKLNDKVEPFENVFATCVSAGVLS